MSEQLKFHRLVREDIIDSLKDIVSSKSRKRLRFVNGQSLTVDAFSAAAVFSVYSALSNDNQKKFKEKLEKDPINFMKLVEFSFKHVS